MNLDGKVKVKVLHNKDCHVWDKALEVVKDVLADKGVSYELKEELITTEEEARREGFSGSPQVKIEGQDVDKQASDITNYNPGGCRIYIYRGRVYEFPPKEMISDFLRDIEGKYGLD